MRLAACKDMKRRLGFSFKPRAVPTVAALVGIVITALLGNWQLNRADEKLRLQQHIEQAGRQAPIHVGASHLNPQDVAYFKVEASGEFKDDGTVYSDNRVRDGVVGYEVITPLRIDGGPYVLVNRGWVKADASRRRLPAVAAPRGQVRVEGMALPGNPRVFELSSDVQAGQVWQNVSVERYRKAFGLALQPIIIEQQNDLGDGLVREWKRPDLGLDRHRGYALQWFSLCAVIIALYVVLNVKRTTQQPNAD
jgi:surfeit locus 1 family protein